MKTDTTTRPLPDASGKNLSGLMTLQEAIERLPKIHGRPIHASTLWRWCRHGCNGIYLSYVRMGRLMMVTEDGLHQFFATLAQQQYQLHVSPAVKRRRRQRSQLHRQRELQEANHILIKAGILKPDAEQSR